MNCFLSLGSNLGDSKNYLRQAIELISIIDGVDLIAVSHFYETAAWGLTNQPDFINVAVHIKTNLQPIKLLDELQAIELKLGRIRIQHWGARTIDIDILLIDDLVIDNERLKVPHQFMFERDFVLIPLSELLDFKFELHGDKVVKTNGSLKDFNLKIIACVDKNFGLGLNNELLFHIEEDMKHFKDLTMNHTVIMGRKTFQSIGKALNNRRNIILSQTLNQIDNAEVIHSLEELCQTISIDEKNFVIGGSEIYQQLFPYVDEIFLTVVDDCKPADTFFPDISEQFICNSTEIHGKFSFKHYCRKFFTCQVLY